MEDGESSGFATFRIELTSAMNHTHRERERKRRKVWVTGSIKFDYRGATPMMGGPSFSVCGRRLHCLLGPFSRSRWCCGARPSGRRGIDHDCQRCQPILPRVRGACVWACECLLLPDIHADSIFFESLLLLAAVDYTWNQSPERPRFSPSVQPCCAKLFMFRPLQGYACCGNEKRFSSWVACVL